MIKWMRPSGNTIETGDTDEIIEYAIANDWEPVDEKKPVLTLDKQKATTNDNSQANS